MSVTYPYAVTAAAIPKAVCVLCLLTGAHPERDWERGIMYWAVFGQTGASRARICKAHAIECDLITDRLVAAKNRAEVAVIQHLRGEEHRHDVCPLPHEDEEVSHRETVPPFPEPMKIRTRAAADAMAPDEVLVIEHIRNRHVPGRYPVTCAMCRLQNRLDSIIEG